MFNDTTGLQLQMAKEFLWEFTLPSETRGRDKLDLEHCSWEAGQFYPVTFPHTEIATNVSLCNLLGRQPSLAEFGTVNG